MDKTLQKGLQVIETLSVAGEPLGVSDLSLRLGYTKSTVHRLLQTLCAVGWVVQSPNSKQYHLSLRLWELAVKRKSALRLPQMARGAALELSRISEETVHVGAFERGEVVFVETIDTPKPIRAYTPLGSRAPAYAVATGKAILAWLPEREWRDDIPTLEAWTDATLSDFDALEADLEQVRKRGFAVNHGEWQQEVNGVAAPIFAGSEAIVVGAIGLSAPAERFEADTIERFAPLVMKAAAAVTKEMGGERPLQ